MNEQTISNIKAVRNEAHEALDNMIAVKGKKHTALVKAFLVSSNMTEVFGLVAHHADIDEGGKKVIQDVYLSCLHGLIVNLARAGEIGEEEMSDAIRDAEGMDKSFTHLMRKAVSAGSAFGDPQ